MTGENLADDEARKIGRRIARLRDARGFTNEALAEKLGVTADSVKKTVAGAATKSYAKLKALAGALDSTPNELLGVSDGHDIEEMMAVVAHSYERLGLPENEAHLYAECVREAIEEPLDQHARQDRMLARRVLASSHMRQFFASRRDRSGLPPIFPSTQPRKSKN